MHSVSGDDKACRGTELTSPLCANFMHFMHTAFYTSSAIGCLYATEFSGHLPAMNFICKKTLE